MQLVIVVGAVIRPGTGCCTYDCCCTVMLPLALSAMACICWVTQAVAAPMPRFGSVWLDCVCLVPNATSCWMVAWMLLGSIWFSRSCKPLLVCDGRGRRERVPAGAALAGVACETSGT